MLVNRTKYLLLFTLFTTLFYGCMEDHVEATVTYQKGTGIYGDINSIRSTPLKGEARPIENPGKIFVSASHILIGEEKEGIHVLDNTNPSSPRNVGFITIPGNREFYYLNEEIYAESYYDMLKINVKDPLNPILTARVTEVFSEEIHNDRGETLLDIEFEEVTETLNKDDDVYFQLQTGIGYAIYDYAGSLIPPSAVPASFAGHSNSGIGSVNRIVAHKEHLYAVSRDNLLVFEDKNQLNLIQKRGFSGRNMETLFPINDLLFIGARSQILLVDLSEPSSPELISDFWHATSCDPVYPTEENIAYATLRTGDFAECPGDINALLVLKTDSTSLPNLHQIQEIPMESPYGLTLTGDKLYVGEGENGLKIFDATDRTNLKLIEWNKNQTAYDVLPHPFNDNIMLIAGPNGLKQLDVAGGYDMISEVNY